MSNPYREIIGRLDDLVKSRFIELFGIPTTNTLGWPTKPMKIVAPSEQISFESSDEDNWLLNLDAVQSDSGQILFKYRVPSSEIKGTIMSFTDKHVLYSKLRPYLNKVVVPDESGFGTTELIPLLPDSKYLTRLYLAYLLRSDAFVSKFSAAVAGTKMPRVSMGTFWNFEVPLPPIELQNEFASFVEQVDKSRFIALKAAEKYDQLVKSRFIEMFGDPIINENKWPTAKLVSLCSHLRNGQTPTNENRYIDKGILFLRSQNVWNNELRLDDSVYISEETMNSIPFGIVKHGDLLITVTGRVNTPDSSLGRISLYLGKEDIAASNKIFIIRLKDEMINEFILRQLLMDSFRLKLRQIAKGGTDKRDIHLTDIQNLKVIIPPTCKQLDFVRFVRQVDKTRVENYRGDE